MLNLTAISCPGKMQALIRTSFPFYNLTIHMKAITLIIIHAQKSEWLKKFYFHEAFPGQPNCTTETFAIFP